MSRTRFLFPCSIYHSPPGNLSPAINIVFHKISPYFSAHVITRLKHKAYTSIAEIASFVSQQIDDIFNIIDTAHQFFQLFCLATGLYAAFECHYAPLSFCPNTGFGKATINLYGAFYTWNDFAVVQIRIRQTTQTRLITTCATLHPGMRFCPSLSLGQHRPFRRLAIADSMCHLEEGIIEEIAPGLVCKCKTGCGEHAHNRK